MSAITLSKTPSPLQLRDELEAKVLKELLGPGSEEEEILESPGTRYLVGVLAPRRRGAWSVERRNLLQRLTLHPPPSTLHPPRPPRKMTKRTARFSTATSWPSVVGTTPKTARPIRLPRRTRP